MKVEDLGGDTNGAEFIDFYNANGKRAGTYTRRRWEDYTRAERRRMLKREKVPEWSYSPL
jgi:hypothetical protein